MSPREPMANAKGFVLHKSSWAEPSHRVFLGSFWMFLHAWLYLLTLLYLCKKALHYSVLAEFCFLWNSCYNLQYVGKPIKFQHLITVLGLHTINL